MMERSKTLPEKKTRGTETCTDSRAQLSQEIWEDPTRNSSNDIEVIGYKQTELICKYY